MYDDQSPKLALRQICHGYEELATSFS